MDQSTLIHFDAALPLDAAPRIDIYAAPHKALRALMFDTVTRVGGADAADAASLAEALAQVRLLLEVARHHVAHENDHVHPLIEAHRPGGSWQTADDHVGHLEAIARLEAEVDAVERSATAQRDAALYRLYLRLARFVAENLEHMEVEETHNTALLRDTCDDAEIGAMLQRLIASIRPDIGQVFHRWMYAAMNHGERVGMLSAIRAGAPAEVFDAEVAAARDVLAPRAWARLANALDLPAGAGVAEAW